MFISTRSFRWNAFLAQQSLSKDFMACVYIFRLIVCPMSVNVSFKMFALDKIHAAIMSPFCAKYDEEADEKQFMGKVSAGDWLSLIHFL